MSAVKGGPKDISSLGRRFASNQRDSYGLQSTTFNLLLIHLPSSPNVKDYLISCCPRLQQLLPLPLLPALLPILPNRLQLAGSATFPLLLVALAQLLLLHLLHLLLAPILLRQTSSPALWRRSGVQVEIVSNLTLSSSLPGARSLLRAIFLGIFPHSLTGGLRLPPDRWILGQYTFLSLNYQ